MDTSTLSGVSQATWRELAGDRNILVLVARPPDALARFGGLIAAAAAAGRSPFVVILNDGSRGDATAAGEATVRLHERRARAALPILGLDRDRLLVAGLLEGSLPTAGPVFDRIVAAMDLVAWRNDCEVICAADTAGADSGEPADDAAVGAIARALSARTRLPLVLRSDRPGARPLALDTDIQRQLAAAGGCVSASYSERYEPA